MDTTHTDRLKRERARRADGAAPTHVLTLARTVGVVVRRADRAERHAMFYGEVRAGLGHAADRMPTQAWTVVYADRSRRPVRTFRTVEAAREFAHLLNAEIAFDPAPARSVYLPDIDVSLHRTYTEFGLPLGGA